MGIVVIVIFTGVTLGYYPNQIKQNHITINNTSNDKTIVFLSDFELQTEKNISKIINKVNELDPDIILLGGDYETIKPLENLKTDKVYAVLGNGDYKIYSLLGNSADNSHAKKITEELTNLGVKVLKNASVIDGDLVITGLDNYSGNNLNQHIPQTDKYVIVLAHTQKNLTIDNSADLYLFGHLHGYDQLPVLKQIINKMLNLVHDSSSVYTTSGLASPRFEPTEITVITLKP